MRNGTTDHGTRKLFFGLLTGGIIGSALALLYAPEKGVRLRKRLRRKTEELAEGAKDQVDHAVDVASDTLEQVKHTGGRALYDAKKTMDSVAEKATKVLHGN